jgi:predicted DNA-binding protein (UPF0251 family)
MLAALERTSQRSASDLERQKADIEAYLRTVYPVTDAEIDQAYRATGYDPSRKHEEVGSHQRQRKVHHDPREVGEIVRFYAGVPRAIFIGVRRALLTLPWQEQLVLELECRNVNQDRIAIRLRCSRRSVQRMKQRALETIALAVFDERGGLRMR